MRVLPLLPCFLLAVSAALTGCSDDEPTRTAPPTEVSASVTPDDEPREETDDAGGFDEPEMTTFGESDAASVSGCLTRSKDGYGYSFSLDVHSGEARYRIRMPHMDGWDDWSSWLGPLSFSSRSGASFGRDSESLTGSVRAQVELEDGERSEYSSPLRDLVACPEV